MRFDKYISTIVLLLISSVQMNNPSQQAREVDTSIETLRALASESIELARVVATNPSIDGNLLRDLVVTGDYITRRNIASNFNTPFQILLKLIRQFPQTVLNNSGFVDSIKHNPNFLLQLSSRSLLHLLKQDRLPICFLEWVAGSQDKKALLAILRHENIPTAVLEKLSKSKFPEVVEGVKLHINGRDKNNKSLEEILFNAVVVADIEKDRYEYSYGERELLKQLLFLDIVPDWILPIFHTDTKFKLANNNDTSSEVLAQLCQYIDLEDKCDRDNFYKLAVQHPNTPSHILEQLIGYESEEVRLLALSHPRTSIDTIQEHYRQHQAVNKLDIDVENLRELATSKDLEIRLQIARNSKTPEDILASFAKASEWQLRLAIAFNLKTSIDTLQELVKDSYWEVRWAVAQNFSTSENILHELLKDKDAEIRDVAERRLEDTSEAANKNSDIIIANNIIPHRKNAPDGIYRMRILSTEMGVVYNSYLNSLKIEKLDDVVQNISRNNWSYRLYVLNENTPVEILQKLAGSEDDYARSRVACQSFIPISILKQLATDKSTQVRINVGRNINSNEEILNILAVDELQQVKNAVICNPNISLDILERVVKEDITNLNNESSYQIAQKLLTEFYCTEELLSLLAEIDKLEIQATLARLKNLSAHILEQLATSQYWQVKELVAKNHNVSLKALEILIQDNNGCIRNLAVDRLIQRNDPVVTDFIYQWNLVNNPDSDTATIDSLVDSQWLVIKLAVASHKNTSPNILEQLLEENAIAIRVAVASNINTPVALLDNLLRDEETKVVKVAINNPSFPIERLEELAADKTSRLRKLAIKSLLDRDIKTASIYLTKYARHSTPTWSRLIAFFHPLTPKQFLIKNNASHIWLERYAIAQNSNTPRQIVEQLTRDGNQIVRDAAVNNLEQNNLTEDDTEDKIKDIFTSLFRGDDLSPEALEIAATRSNNKVLLAVANHPHTPKSILDKLVRHNNCKISQAASLHINYDDKIPKDWENIVEKEIINLIRSTDFDVRRNIAQLGLIPESIIERLVQENNSIYEVDLAVSASNIPIDILKQLARDTDEYICLFIAKNSYTPSDLLKHLSQRSDYYQYNVLSAVAANPNTPISTLEILATKDNPEVQEALIQNPNTPQKIKEKLNLLKQSNSAIVNLDIPTEKLLILAKDKNSKTRNLAIFQLENIAKNSNTPVNIVEDLATIPNTKIMSAIAGNPNTPVRILEDLATEGDRNIFINLLGNPNTPKNILEQLSTEIINLDTSTLQKIVRKPDISANILEQIAKVSDSKILQEIAAHPNTSISTLEYLATKTIRAIYIAVIKNSNTPEHILEQLSEEIKNCGMYALEEIAQQPNMPLSILEELSTSQYALVQRGVTKNPKTPVSILKNIMGYGYSGAWDGIAVNPNTTVEMLEELINYSTQEGITNDSVPVSIAKNPNTPVYLLEKLAGMTEDKKNKWIQANHVPIIQGRQIAVELAIALVENPNLPLHFLEYFAREDKGEQIRGSVAQNPRTPINILKQLSTDSNLYWYLLQNPNLPPQIAKKIARDKNDRSKRTTIYDNPHTPQSVLKNLAFNPSGEVRKEVAKHPNISLDVLSELIGDINNIIRQTVRENSNIPTSLIEEVKEAYYNACYSTSAKELAQLANTDWHYVSAAVASNINTPISALEQITTNKISYLTEDCDNLRYRCLQTLPIISSLANNLNATQHILEQLLTLLTNKDEVSEVIKQIKTIRIQQYKTNINHAKTLQAIASHNNASENILNCLSNNKDYIIRSTVANHQNISLVLLAKLIKDSDKRVRKIAIENYLKKYPQGLSEVLALYSKNSQPNIARLLTLLQPQIPAKILVKKSRSLYWLERYAVATNPNTPNDIQQKLINDPNSIVRYITLTNSDLS